MTCYKVPVKTKAKNRKTGEVREAAREVNVVLENGVARVVGDRLIVHKRKKWVEVR